MPLMIPVQFFDLATDKDTYAFFMDSTGQVQISLGLLIKILEEAGHGVDASYRQFLDTPKDPDEIPF